MTYIPGLVRLKDPALIDRWGKLAPYVRKAPSVGEFVIMVNTFRPEWQVAIRRSANTPSSAFFMKVDSDDVEKLSSLGEGSLFSAVMTEYKVDGNAPFIIRRTTVTDMRVSGDDLKLADEKKPFAWLRTLIMAFREVRSGILEPDAHELDELLEFLRGADPREPDHE